MSCSGGHLGFPISIKNLNFVEDLPMITLQTLGFLFRYEIQNGGYSKTKFNFGPYGKNVSKRFFSETTRTIETKLPRNNHLMVL
jgi:hypothetical protein